MQWYILVHLTSLTETTLVQVQTGSRRKHIRVFGVCAQGLKDVDEDSFRIISTEKLRRLSFISSNFFSFKSEISPFLLSVKKTISAPS